MNIRLKFTYKEELEDSTEELRKCLLHELKNHLDYPETVGWRVKLDGFEVDPSEVEAVATMKIFPRKNVDVKKVIDYLTMKRWGFRYTSNLCYKSNILEVPEDQEGFAVNYQVTSYGIKDCDIDTANWFSREGKERRHLVVKIRLGIDEYPL